MTDPIKRGVGILHGTLERIEDLEESISTDEGEPNILLSTQDQMTADDTATISAVNTGATFEADSSTADGSDLAG